MGGLKSFNEILMFVAAQLCLLAVISVIGVWLAASGAASRSFQAAGYFVMAGAMLAALRFVWPVMIEPVELFWGTSAKVRVKKWLLPALYGAASAFLTAAVVALFVTEAPFFSIILSIVTELALVAPLAVTALLFYSAWRRRIAIRGGLEKMQDARNAVDDADAALRIDASIATERGSGATTVRANPQGFVFAGLTSKPWHDPRDFPWLGAFVEATDEILAEAEAVMTNHDGRVEPYKYVGLDGDFWRSFKLATRHQELPENLALCPKTASLLKTIPGYPSFRDAMFSILGPGGVISSHRDVSNVFVTLHLPLIAHGDGYMEVGGMRKYWRKGEPLVFDSAYNHEAVNPSDKTRVVLLVDFLHPELSEEERAWVRAARL